jgi:predicted DsbA family dithiol-disulfide isomerase
MEAALARFEGKSDVEVVWRSFELDRFAPARRQGDMVDHLAQKYGMSRDEAIAGQRRLTDLAASEGLEYHLDRTAGGNTFDAHRLLHLAGDHGVQDELKERLMRAYFTEGRPIGDQATLTELAGEVGLDQTEVAEVLGGSAFADAVRADEEVAAGIGISGVPFFVVNRRYAVSGAQSADVLLEGLRKGWTDDHPLVAVPSDAGASCDGDACDI